MDLTIIRDVELVSVGMEWPSANGPITFTFEHLRDAMIAANDDPHVVPPRLKIGHTDPRFADEDDPGHDPFYDGEPALGSVYNLRLVNDGATLIGDYVEMPVWLAEVLPTAYPSRSIEGAYSVEEGPAGEPIGSWDVETPGGKKYTFVLTACALLGLSRPAVQDLEDLRRFLTEGDGVVISGTEPEGGEPAAATMGTVKGKQTADATASVDKVIDAFYDEVTDPADPRYWWWVRDVWTDPNVLIVDDDDGGLLEVSFTSSADQEVTFGEGTKVMQVFVPAPEAAAAAARSLHDGDPVRSFASASASRPSDRVRQGGSDGRAALRGMKLSDAQRTRLAAKLGLAEDATEEQIEEALEAPEDGDGNEGATGDGDGNGDEGTSGDDTGDGEGDGDEGEGSGDAPAASAADDTTVTLDKAAWEENQRQLARLAAAEDKRVASHRKGVIDAAVKDGKIMPSSRKAWETKMATEPEATEKEIADLEAGLVPVDESGHSRQGDPATAMAEADAAFAFLYPNLANQGQEAA